jgi:hypothetical protein
MMGPVLAKVLVNAETVHVDPTREWPGYLSDLAYRDLAPLDGLGSV